MQVSRSNKAKVLLTAVHCLFYFLLLLSDYLHYLSKTMLAIQLSLPQFISPDMWPANSRGRVPSCDTDELQQWLVETWAEFQHSMMFVRSFVIAGRGPAYSGPQR